MTDSFRIVFSKISCNGNCFLVLDDQFLLGLTSNLISCFCRKYQSDGLIRLFGSGTFRKIEFYNSDGSAFNMSFNGTLCAAFLLKQASRLQDLVIFTPVGLVKISDNIKGLLMEFPAPSFSVNICRPRIKPVAGEYCFVRGVDPHLIVFIDSNPFQLSNFQEYATVLRHDRTISSDGQNVHFVYGNGYEYYIRHFEKGVENETLSCGSGCISASMVIPAVPGVIFRSPGGSCFVDNTGVYNWVFSADPVKLFEAEEILTAC